MKIFVDFEASSLAKASYPIEVGWAGEDGSEESWLIGPLPHWSDWAEDAEAIHRIPRAQLLAEGKPPAEVARRMTAALTGHALYCTAPSWDGHWLSLLLRAGGLPRHALRLQDADEAHLETAREILKPAVGGSAVEGAAQKIVRRVKQDFAGRPIAHRALADAILERDLWLTVRRDATRVAEAARHPEA